MKLLSLEILNTQNSNSGNPVQCYIKTILTLTVRETHMREDNRKHTMGRNLYETVAGQLNIVRRPQNLKKYLPPFFLVT